jgi:hypothetical protein
MRRWFLGRFSQLLANVRFVSDLLNPPAGNRVKRRCAQCFSCAQAEAGVVPRTAHGFANNKTLGQGSMVVSTGCSNGEEIISMTCQNYIFTINLPQNHSAVGKIAQRKSSF